MKRSLSHLHNNAKIDKIAHRNGSSKR